MRHAQKGGGNPNSPKDTCSSYTGGLARDRNTPPTPERGPTCRVLGRHGAPVENGAVPGDGPNLVGAADGNGLEGLVRPDVQPGSAL